jgi:hypothetical protein
MQPLSWTIPGGAASAMRPQRALPGNREATNQHGHPKRLSHTPIPARRFPATNDAIVATNRTVPLNRRSVLIEPSEDVSKTPLPIRTPSAPDVRLLEQVVWRPRHPRDDGSQKDGQIQGWNQLTSSAAPSLR